MGDRVIICKSYVCKANNKNGIRHFRLNSILTNNNSKIYYRFIPVLFKQFVFEVKKLQYCCFSFDLQRNLKIIHLLIFVLFVLNIIQIKIQSGMQRQTTQQSQYEQSQMKLQMLQSNIIRVISQNKRLQHLLEYRDFFPKLKDHVLQISSNWNRLTTIITAVNDLDAQIKAERQNMLNSVNHYYEHINQHIVQQIKDQRVALGRHQERINQVKNRQRVTVKKHFLKLKNKLYNHIKHTEGQIMDVVKSAENTFVEKMDKEILPKLVEKVEKEFEIHAVNCKMQLGHVQNLLSYYSSVQKKEEGSPASVEKRQFVAQDDLGALYSKIEDTLQVNTSQMQMQMIEMEGKLRGISSEIGWLQNKNRKMKRVNTKQPEQSHSNLEQFTQNPKLIQIKLQLQQLWTQLMGLGKFCDQATLQKKIICSIFKEKENEKDRLLVTHNHEYKMFAIKQKLTQLQTKIGQYQHFFKNFHL